MRCHGDRFLDIKKFLEKKSYKKISYKDNKGDINTLVGISPSMLNIFEFIEKLKDSDSSVLLSGPTGTGKELIAQAIHFRGKRKMKPFIAVNCGRYSTELFESEMFGYEKGAFTGAFKSQKGKMELSNGGTLFLDEISFLNLRNQTKLLRALETNEFFKVGGTTQLRINFRLICATNVNLMKKISCGTFRKDLFHRICIINIPILPLKKRPEDIEVLIPFFISFFNEKNNKNLKYVSTKVINKMARKQWEGNVRELKNFINTIITIIDDNVTHLDLNIYNRICSMQGKENEEQFSSKNILLKEERKEYILEVLKETNWNKTKAAKIIGIHRNTLAKWLKILYEQ